MAFVFVGLGCCLSSAGAVVIESLNLKAQAAVPARHTPTSPATKPPKQIVLRDGALTVYRRSRSQRYQCRFRLPSGTWHRQTTGASADPCDASEVKNVLRPLCELQLFKPTRL